MNSKQYEIDISNLFDEWIKREHHHNGEFFNKDGIVNPEKWYSKESNRILFLLKEAHQGKKKGDLENSNGVECKFDNLIDYIKSNNKGVFKRTSLMYFALVNGMNGQRLDFTDYKSFEDTQESRSKRNQEIAVVNIKKSCGRTRSKNKDLKKYVEKDKDFISNEIDIISPKIIIGGNIRANFETIIGKDKLQCIDKENWLYYLESSRTFYIDSYHPAASLKDKFFFDKFNDIGITIYDKFQDY